MKQLKITNKRRTCATFYDREWPLTAEIPTHSPSESQARVLIRNGVTEITLTTGETAIIDTQDLAAVVGHKWCARGGYAQSTTARGLLMHRAVLGLAKGDPRHADHIDGNGLNNRRDNLRICNQRQNRANSRKFVGKSKYRGVIARGLKWGAELRQRKEGGGMHRWWLGLHATQELAAAAYDRKAAEVFGSFVRLNLPSLTTNPITL